MKFRFFVFTIALLIMFPSCKSSENIIISDSNYNVQSTTIGYIPFVDDKTNKFSIVIIPDSQSYLDFRCQKNPFTQFPVNQYEMYYKQMEFIARNSISEGGDFSFAIHVGDQVDHRGWNITEWNRAHKALEIIDNKLPFLTVIGNHDYDRWTNSKTPQGTFLYNQYFGPNSQFYKNKDWYGGASKNGASSWAKFSACENEFLVISLEMDPIKSDIDWAQNIINNNTGIPTIIAIHSYLDVGKETLFQNGYTNPYPSVKEHKFSAKEIWTNFISKNDQIFLVLCGHSFSETLGTGFRKDINDFGNTTYSILTNYQARNESFKKLNSKKDFDYGCGDGWLRTLNFNLLDQTLTVKTYSTEFNKYEIDSESEYIIPIDFNNHNRYK